MAENSTVPVAKTDGDPLAAIALCMDVMNGSCTLCILTESERKELKGLDRYQIGEWSIQSDDDEDELNQAIESTRMNVKYKEPPLLLRNNGAGILENPKETAGQVFSTAYLGRGLAVGLRRPSPARRRERSVPKLGAGATPTRRDSSPGDRGPS